MDIKQVYEALEKIENGAEMIAVIKADRNQLTNEAKGHRLNSDKYSNKLKSVLEGLELEDSDDVVDKIKELKNTLNSFAQDGKKPSDVAKQIAELNKQVTNVTKQLADMTATAQAEKTKRFEAMKQGLLVDALTKGNAAAPKDMARLIAENIVINDDESVIYKNGDTETSVEDGVKAWLSANAWAVKATPQSGGGSPAGGGSGEKEAILQGFLEE